jgi:hypothetical protein
MPNPAMAALETALRARKLERTLTTAVGGDAGVAPTHIAALDACLQGGVPRGQLSEIAGPRSSGRTTVLLQIIAAATERGEMAALVDACDRLDVASAIAAGIEMDRLLWIRAQGCLRPQTWPSPEARGLGPDPYIERSLKAFHLVLQAGNVGLVALDLADVPVAALNRIPFTTWLRVQRAIEGSETACLLVVPQPLARSAGGLTLSLTGRMQWVGDAPRSRRASGLDVAVRVVSPRRRVEGTVNIGAQVHGCSGA